MANTLDWLGAAWRGWAAGEGERWLYVGRTLVAAFVALWLAYRLELDSPSTSMTTVFILALPSSGQVLEKAFYRLLGTVTGCACALVLVGLFPQQAPLLFCALAIWIGLCTAGASMYRNSQSYSFVLAGYTAVLIVLPALDHPTVIFSVAVTRVTEVSLGILCSTFVGDALFPRHQSVQVQRSVQARYARFVHFCHDVLEQRLAPSEVEVTHMQFAADIAALESGRAAAFFEAVHVRADTRHLHAFNAAFMTALTTFYTLHRLVHRLRDKPSPALALCEPLFADLGAALHADPAGDELDRFHAALAQRIGAARAAMQKETVTRAEGIDFDTAAELMTRFTANMRAFQALYRGLGQHQRRQFDDIPPYTPKTPLPIIVGSGGRAAFVMLLMASIWYRLDWAYAPSAMLMTVVFAALASSSPRPTRVVGQALVGFIVGLPVAFVSVYFLLVQAHGYPMLILCTAPALALGTYLNGTPKYAGVGVGMNLFLTQNLIPANQLVVDPVAFMNNGLALTLGVALAWVVFKVVLPEYTMGQRDHVAAALWRETLATCEARPGNRLRHRFDNRVRDLLSQLNAAAGPAPDAATRTVVRQALTLLELGHSTIELRELIAASEAGEARRSLEACVARFAAYLRRPDQERCRAAVDAILQAGLHVRAALAASTPARAQRMQTALADLHSIYTSLLDQLPQAPAPAAPSPLGEPDHAA
jgi:uncharacterized membrane protein YccC